MSDIEMINPPTRYAGGGWVANPLEADSRLVLPVVHGRTTV